VTRTSDVRRLRGHAVGLAATGTRARLDEATLTPLHDRPLPAPPRRVPPAVIPADAVRRAGLRLDGERYRVDFPVLGWDGGTAVRPELAARAPGGSWGPAAPAGEWYLLSGEHGHRGDLLATTTVVPVHFDRAVGAAGPDVAGTGDAVVLHGTAEGYDDVTLTWSLDGCHPVAVLRAVPRTGGHHVVLHSAFDELAADEVEEVLCGPLQHGRMVRGPELLGAFELTAPLALVELRRDGSPTTWGVWIPATELTLADEEIRDPDDQPFGMCLRGPGGGVRPTVASPQYGRRAHVEAGEEVVATVGLFAADVPLHEAYRRLLREEYGYRPYRRNVFGQSLTDTVFNLVDLLAVEPPADDADDYQASPSGWWSRAKGFIDIENDQTVRTTTTAVLLSAAYLTDDMDLYDRRARPLVEHHVSRNGYGWTPKRGYAVYGDDTRTELCSTPFGVTALGALHEVTRRANPGIARLALADDGSDQDYWLKRAPMSVPLATYRLTRDPVQLDRARELAEAYVREHVDVPREDPVDPHDFGIYYCADWIGLLELYEETGEERWLDAAHREARRFVTQVFVRPVHDGAVVVPDRPQYRDRQIEMSRWWDPAALYDYPVTDIAPEPADRWVLSMTGLSFEAVQTYRYSGPSLNPAWAAPLLRLAHRTGNDLLRDVAHNAAVGRWTNYPGYYLRQHTVAPLKPDFPVTGPFDNSTIYYHHAPAQLGLTLDYLVTEHETRSGGAVRFPAAFEENFVWFRFRTYGHLPGTFHGDDGVWLWMPRGVVELDNPQVSWLSAERGGTRFYLSLSNAAPHPQRVTVRFGDVLGLPDDADRPVTVIAGGVRRTATTSGSTLAVDVAGHGVTAVILDAVGPVTPATHPTAAVVPGPARPAAADDDPTTVFADDSPVGAVRALLLARPDGSGHDAYVQSRCATPATLSWSVDGGATWHESPKPQHPAEWTVRLPPSAPDLRFRVSSGDAVTADMTLRGAPC
jgi:hypothetical protein